MTEQGYFFGKKVVITGASGFIGSRLARELIGQGAHVTALARPNPDLWRIGDLASTINWSYPDFYDAKSLSAELQRLEPDFIYHLATYYAVDNNVDLAGIIDTNIRLGACLVKAAGRIENLKLFVNAGTCAEYGDVREPADEETRLAPSTVYASTKAAATLVLSQMAADEGVPLTTLRLYNLYGEHESAKRIVPYIILSMLDNKDVSLTACEQEKDYSYVGDFVRAFMQAAVEHKAGAGKLFNIGSGKAIKMRRLVEEIAANLPESKARIDFGALPYRENEMWYQCAVIEEAKKHLNWRPETGLEEGVRKTVDWYRRNCHLYHG